MLLGNVHRGWHSIQVDISCSLDEILMFILMTAIYCADKWSKILHGPACCRDWMTSSKSSKFTTGRLLVKVCVMPSSTPKQSVDLYFFQSTLLLLTHQQQYHHAQDLCFFKEGEGATFPGVLWFRIVLSVVLDKAFTALCKEKWLSARLSDFLNLVQAAAPSIHTFQMTF